MVEGPYVDWNNPLGINSDNSALYAAAMQQRLASASVTNINTAPDAHNRSYLEYGVNLVTAPFIHDQQTRDTVNQYGAEFFKTAALFATGRTGLFGSLAVYGLSQASPDTPILQQGEDFLLGAAKGGAMRGIFNVVGANIGSAPLKGVLIGIGSRGTDAIFQRDLFTDPSRVGARLQAETMNPTAWIFDGVTWGLGEGLFHGINAASGGRLAANRIASGMFMGGSFGFVSGGAGEIVRQTQAGQGYNWNRILGTALIDGGINAAGAGFGMKVSDPAFHARVADIITGRRAQTGQTSGAIGEVLPVRNEQRQDTISLASLTDARNAADDPSRARQFVITSGQEALANFRQNSTADMMLNVREVLGAGTDGTPHLGEVKRLFVQRLGDTDGRLNPMAQQADLIASCHPENLPVSDQLRHVFPTAEGRVWMLNGPGDRLLLAAGESPISVWRARGFTDPVRLDFGRTTINVMAPLVVGDPANPNSPTSRAAWAEFARQLAEAKRLGIDAVSTDVWWGLIEQQRGQFDWSYYDKLSQHITDAGLKWIPILSFHQAGGNVGDDVTVRLPSWVWSAVSPSNPEAAKFVSEQGHSSNEYISFWATPQARELYSGVMSQFQQHFAGQAGNIAELNISLGPSGELRYPSYNQHDNNAGWPTRGALQSYSEMAENSFRQFALGRYGGIEGVRRAWNLPELQESQILPPSDPNQFFGENNHTKIQYGRDFFDWYNQSLIDHGRTMLETAQSVFSAPGAPFESVELGAKIPGVHWRVGDRNGDSVQLGDRLAELTAGLIRTSGNDWNSDAQGRGYRPLLSMFRGLQPMRVGVGAPVVPSFTAMEMSDGVDGPAVHSLPHTLATWLGEEGHRQGLSLNGENALASNLGSNQAWDNISQLLNLPGSPGNYHGITLLRMSDVLNDPVARARVSEIINAIRSIKPPLQMPPGGSTPQQKIA
jgi:hypothetical protein